MPSKLQKARAAKFPDLTIYSGRPSDGARELAIKTSCRYIREANTRSLRPFDGNLVVNWGNTSLPHWLKGTKLQLLNNPANVKAAISKVYSYGKFKEAGIPTLEHTLDAVSAKQWVAEGHAVLARRDGLSSGAGITFVGAKELSPKLPARDFYCRYFPKTHEYRVHVFKGRVIDITQKKRSSIPGQSGDRDVYQRVVRSLENGWIHAHEDLHLPDAAREEIEKASIGAVHALGLDFGAVDVLARYSKKNQGVLRVLAVCEVNTAPGLGNQVTFDAYSKAIVGAYEESKQDRVVQKKLRRIY